MSALPCANTPLVQTRRCYVKRKRKLPRAEKRQHERRIQKRLKQQRRMK